MKESVGLHILYRTAPGRVVLKALVRPEISVLGGLFMKSRLSKPLIAYYLKTYDISLKGIEVPVGGFQSFNDFFTRKKRAFAIKGINGRMISPCDAFLSCIPIKDTTVLSIKHTEFTVNDLLLNNKLAEKFKDGVALVYRLTPAHYHRYAFVADGVIKRQKRIDGVLHTVQPVATAEIPVFVQNSREYQVIESDNFGTVVQMEIGALMVGKISNHKKYKERSRVRAGAEKGYFEFGGSTIVVLLQKDAVEFNDEFKALIARGGEVPINIGDVISK